MSLTCLLVDDSPVTADLRGLAAVTLLGRHEFDAAVAAPSFPLIPRFQERCHPSDQYTRGLEDMTDASLQRGRQG